VRVTHKAIWNSIDDFLKSLPPDVWIGEPHYDGPIEHLGGSKPKVVQTNPGQASAAMAGATGAAGTAGKYSSDLFSKYSDTYNTLFGKEGAVRGFLDPSKLDVDRPTGVFEKQYQNARGIVAKQGKAARGNISRTFANRGFGGDMSGMEAGYRARADQGQAATAANLFGEYAGKSYEDALTKFWTAVGLTADASNAAMSGALSANSAQAQTYANLYGTAGQGNALQGKPGIGGALIGAAGSIAGGALACLALDSDNWITLYGGTKKLVDSLDGSEVLEGVDGGPEKQVRPPEDSVATCFKMRLANGMKAVASDTHTWYRRHGGYAATTGAADVELKTKRGPSRVAELVEAGVMKVRRLFLDRSHTYAVNGIWCME
jgi:hypothetical protein